MSLRECLEEPPGTNPAFELPFAKFLGFSDIPPRPISLVLRDFWNERIVKAWEKAIQKLGKNVPLQVTQTLNFSRFSEASQEMKAQQKTSTK